MTEDFKIEDKPSASSSKVVVTEKTTILTFLTKNPIIAIIVTAIIVFFLIWIFNRGKDSSASVVPELKVEDISSNPDLGKTEAQRLAFNAKAIAWAKKVFDLTEGVHSPIFSDVATEKGKVYGELVKLNKTQLTLVNDKWIDRWLVKNGESMWAAIASDHHWWAPSPANEAALLKLLTEYELNDN